MPASTSDLLTAQQNFVTATGNNGQISLQISGLTGSYGLTATTQVKTGTGRLATVSVIVAGSGAGKIYDASNTTDVTRPFFVIPMTVGVTVVNMPFSHGLVVAPGSGQTASVSYS